MLGRSVLRSAEEYLREISEIERGSEMRYRNRTWGNKYEDLSEILSESYRERARIGVRMCSGRYRNVIGMLSGYVRDEIGMGAEWERESKSKYLGVRNVSD